MNRLFLDTDYNATNWSITIPPTNNGITTGSLINDASSLYGKSSYVYVAPPSGVSTRQFTISL